MTLPRPPTAPGVPVVAVAPGADGDVELHLVVDVVGLSLAQIPVDPRAPEHHPAGRREAGEQPHGGDPAPRQPQAPPTPQSGPQHRGKRPRLPPPAHTPQP